MQTRQEMLEYLNNAIVALENRHVIDDKFKDRQSALPADFNRTPHTPAGSLNEVWSDGYRDTGAALGFTLAQARRLLTMARPVVLWLQLSHDGLETGLLYGPGLSTFGFDPAQMIIGRMKRIEDLLWATEEAIACRSVAAVITDVTRFHTILDFTVSRRLSLRAQNTGTAVFMMRYGQNREASAARFRWHVAAIKSAKTIFDTQAPGSARWRVHLEKGQQQAGIHGGRDIYILNWTKDGLEIDEHTHHNKQELSAAASLSGASSVLLGDRLPQTA